MKAGDQVYVSDLMFVDKPNRAEVLYASPNYVVFRLRGFGAIEDCIDLRRGDRTVAHDIRGFFKDRAAREQKNLEKHRQLMERAANRVGLLSAVEDQAAANPELNWEDLA